MKGLKPEEWTVDTQIMVLVRRGFAISRLDAFLNDQLLPHATAVLDRAESAIGAVQLQVEQVGMQATDSILLSQRPLLKLEELISDPAIKASLANIEKTTESGARTMNNVERKTQQLLKPPRLAYRILADTGSFIWRTFLKP